MDYKNLIQERTWALEDLKDMKERQRFNEYVTAANIDEWIKGQEEELRALKMLRRKELWERLCEAHKLDPIEREQIKIEYSQLVKETGGVIEHDNQ